MLTDTKTNDAKAHELIAVPLLTKPSRGTLLAIGIATVAFVFLNMSAFKYLSVARDTYGVFWPRREWLFAHVLAGTVAILLGPLQFWLAANRRKQTLHRVLGILYAGSVAAGSLAAIQLARMTDFGWVFGAGLASMAVTWFVSTAMAVIAICRSLVEQHREWMTRSYVVTFGFVTFRVVDGILELARVGVLSERLAAASWICWAIPLMLVEVILQGRKILTRPKSASLPS